MIRDRKTFFLSIAILITPLLGIPSFWRTSIIVICALVLVLTSVDFAEIHIFPAKPHIPDMPQMPLEEKREPEMIVDMIKPKKRVYRPRKKKIEDVVVTPLEDDRTLP